MRFKLVIISLLFLLFAIIAVQNTIQTELKFLSWAVQAPLIIMILVIFVLGLLIGLVFCSYHE
ncbi:MAG: lipopolysaccharide assembly protein LapA domain-containing protein, partial [Ignavibacteriales bacterium]